MADRVAVRVNIDTCLRQFATVASNRNSRGKAKVAICNAITGSVQEDERNRHRFASPSNSRPIRAAQPWRVTLPSASLRTQSYAAWRPTTAPPAATVVRISKTNRHDHGLDAENIYCRADDRCNGGGYHTHKIRIPSFTATAGRSAAGFASSTRRPYPASCRRRHHFCRRWKRWSRHSTCCLDPSLSICTRS